MITAKIYVLPIAHHHLSGRARDKGLQNIRFCSLFHIHSPSEQIIALFLLGNTIPFQEGTP
jgi:hypothetical protein